MANYYNILGLQQGCTFDEVKSAYRTLSMKYHPDINGDNEDNRKNFYEITEAYNAIKKDTKKIFKLLGMDNDTPIDDVKVEYKRQLEELEFRIKMSNPGAQDQLDELKNSYNLFNSAYKNDQNNW